MTDSSSWLVAEPCASSFHSLRSSLVEATKLRPENEDLSSITNSAHQISLKCGNVKYQEHRTAWSMHHKSKSDERSRIESLGFAGKDRENLVPDKPIMFRSAKRICRLTCKSRQLSSRDAPLSPPIPLVQLIFRAVELISMLERARGEYHATSFKKILCWSKVTRRYIDVEPIFTALWQLHASQKARKRVVDKLLVIAIESVSDIAQQMVEPWGKKWNIFIDLPRRTGKLKSYLRASLKSIKYFIRACLVSSKNLRKPIKSSLNTPEHPKIRIDQAIDSSTIFDAREVSVVESTSMNGAEEYNKINNHPIHLKSTCLSVSDTDKVKASFRKREIVKPSFESVQCTRSPESPPLNSDVHNRERPSTQSESCSQAVSTCASPVTDATVAEPRDADSGNKDTELPAIETGSNLETSSDTQEYPANKEQRLFQSASRKCRDDDLGETLNLIVDEDSCTSRNDIHEVSSQSTEKPANIVEQPVDTKHEKIKIVSQVTALRDLNSLDSGSEETPELSEQLKSGNLSSFSDHFAGSELCVENFDERNTSWVQLSHMGHISDYHGYQRQHQSFVPLKYSTSVSETCVSLQESLKELRSIGFTKGDEDADSDQENYDAAVLSYSTFQDYERTQRRESTHEVSTTTKQVPFDTDFDIRPFRFTSATSADLPNLKKRKFASLRPGNRIPTPIFTSIESDPLTFWRNNQSSAKRPRRTAELNELKKISVMMLSEMYHTLRFIEDYNKGFFNESDVNSVALTSGTRFDGQAMQQEQKAKVPEPPSRNKSCSRVIDSDVESVTKSLNALALKTMFTKTNFKEIQKQFISVCDLPDNSKFEALRLTIESAIGDEKVRVYSDEEIVKEEKSRTRIARGYRRKADQEKIEKKHHEHERLLLMREFEYANRNKKASAMEIEMERIETRSIMVDQPGTESNTKRCPLGTSCIICIPPPMSQESTQTEDGEVTIIHNPRFRQVDLDAVQDEDPQSGLGSAYDTQDASLRSLMEMKHILTFIEKYSKGLIR